MVYAHSRKDGNSLPWQELSEHLNQVGRLAQSFSPKQLAELARVAGLWHDIGKFNPAFQQYIGQNPELSNEAFPTPQAKSVPHSAAGAALALERLPNTVAGQMLALVIAAHHGALKSGRFIDTIQASGTPLLQASRTGGLPLEFEQQTPSFPGTPSALAVRMLFSALVDADLLNTEEWDTGASRPTSYSDITTLRNRLDAFCLAKIETAQATASTEKEKRLAAMRRSVLEACILAADTSPGHFTMTVPTGGGKTLSGLAFALHHAERNGMSRVIVVAPYTSILEQTADVYRQALGAENVIEHHSNIGPNLDTDRNRQACENWDAPIIVTTSVQLLESLHAAHKRDCRKLHRVANSVILLDEVQTFPVDLLQPIHAALKRLADDFHVTVVHGTATQPLMAGVHGKRNRSVLPKELAVPMREIMPDPASLFNAMRDRFTLEIFGELQQPLDPALLAEDVKKQGSALVITHSRKDARLLADLLGPQCLHLSAAMCAAHRSDVLREARQRLDISQPCTIVATQLVEAGVDIDFPVVYRALAGLETLAQAAGRCNRAMKLPQPGRFIVYRAGRPNDTDEDIVDSRPPRGTPQLSMEVALTEYFARGIPNLHDPMLFPGYAGKVLSMQDTDRHGIRTLEDEGDFEEVATHFRMIEETHISVVAPYGDAPRLLRELQQQGPTRQRFRALQRYTVGLSKTIFDALFRSGWLEPVLQQDTADASLWCVREGDTSPYDERFGFASRERDVKLPNLQA
ncbi:CRISPR-associated endonuclease Cas3'' [Terriglobus tenax]|uniref:CRISPR-associated endonuclease Cas3'' n=1 Tax=Terriglobus tenax TaxID=1111115 RepID=UPI0021DF85BF|nr:CRISPR-associated endonuclease Cas3'' [Terriglobus tenax]